MKNQNNLILVYCYLIMTTLASCKQPTPKDLSNEPLIPMPVEVSATNSSFEVTNSTKITSNLESSELTNYFAQLIRPATGFELGIVQGATVVEDLFNFLISENYPELGQEGYKLEITEKAVILEANTEEGIFRGVQTIRQLFPPEIENSVTQNVVWELASGTIIDYPNYEFRSAMLDVSRHFFDVDEVKQFIDWLARYKFNTLHLGLTNDQGWRIEIKKWPLLTEIGGSTEVNGGKGGFYTQEQYSELVKYAQANHITIIPEIDMPGHTNAALASYAKLNCDGNIRELYTGIDVGFSTLCTRDEFTYEFVNDVITELAAITPGPYIHIGGDESHSTEKEDYIYFVERVQEIVNSAGKQMIGWDEVATTKLSSNSVAQFWASEENAKMAVSQNAKIIMSPAKRAYLDMKYDSTTVLGLNWAGFIEIDTGYDWALETYVKGVERADILGIECPLWSETVTNIDEVEQLVFPRLLGYAEIGWSATESRNWEDYSKRLGRHAPRFDAKDINYYASKQIEWEK